MKIEQKYVCGVYCCNEFKYKVWMSEGIDFDSDNGDFYYIDKPEEILKECPFCGEKFEKIEYDF